MESVMKEMRITLETLYDILLNEKRKAELQPLEESFFLDVIVYLKEKQAILEAKKHEDDLFAEGEQEKLEYELRSIKKILKEIYERREKKIIDLALNRSRTQSDLIDTNTLLAEERMLYTEFVALLDAYRKGILFALFKGGVPFVAKTEAHELKQLFEEKKPPVSARKEESEGSDEDSLAAGAAQPRMGGQLPSEAIPQIEPPAPAAIQPMQQPEEKGEMSAAENENNGNGGPLVVDYKKVIFTRPVPSFVGTDLKIYGPFGIGEAADVPADIAEVLVEKERAKWEESVL